MKSTHKILSFLNTNSLNPFRWGADKRRGVRNAIFNSGEFLIPLALWVFAAPLFKDRLGDERFGLYFLAIGIAGMSGMASFGLTHATVKYVSANRTPDRTDKLNSVVRSTVTLYCILGIIAGATVTLLAPFIASTIKLSDSNIQTAVVALRITGAVILSRFIYSIFQSILYGFERHDIAAKAGTLLNASFMGINIYQVSRGADVPVLLAAIFICQIIASLILVCLIKTKLPIPIRIAPSLDKKPLKEVLGFGTFTWIQALIGSVTQNIAGFLIAMFVDTAAIPYYNLSRKLALISHSLLSKASSFLFPFASAMKESGHSRKLQKVYNESTFILVIAGTAMIMPVYLLGTPILTVWMDAQFALNSAPILRILCIGTAMLPLGIVNYHYMLGLGLVRMQTLIAVASASIYVAALFLFLPIYGVTGAALAYCSMVPISYICRIYVTSKISGKASVRSTLAYTLPILVPFAIATPLLSFFSALPLTLVTIALTAAALFAVTATISFVTASIFRKLKLIPGAE